jgi:hypothetical protein
VLALDLDSARRTAAATLASAAEMANESPRAASHAAPPPVKQEPQPAAPAGAQPAPPPAGVPAEDDSWADVPLAARYEFATQVEVQVNGNGGWLCDLSTTGCQVLTPGMMKPGQAIRIALPGKPKPTQCVGKVIWAQLEPPSSGRPICYRAGVNFTKVDAAAAEAFAVAHGAPVPRR